MDSLCELIHHPHNVYEIRMHKKTRQAVDVMAGHMWALIESWDIDEHGDEMRLLINMSESGVPSVTYAMRKIRNWFSENSSDLNKIHIREAYLAPSGSEIVLSLADSFAKILPLDIEVKFFPAHDYDGAMTWLRQTDETTGDTSS
jgi:hypothetical protein